MQNRGLILNQKEIERGFIEVLNGLQVLREDPYERGKLLKELGNKTDPKGKKIAANPQVSLQNLEARLNLFAKK